MQLKARTSWVKDSQPYWCKSWECGKRKCRSLKHRWQGMKFPRKIKRPRLWLCKTRTNSIKKPSKGDRLNSKPLSKSNLRDLLSKRSMMKSDVSNRESKTFRDSLMSKIANQDSKANRWHSKSVKPKISTLHSVCSSKRKSKKIASPNSRSKNSGEISSTTNCNHCRTPLMLAKVLVSQVVLSSRSLHLLRNLQRSFQASLESVTRQWELSLLTTIMARILLRALIRMKLEFHRGECPTSPLIREEEALDRTRNPLEGHLWSRRSEKKFVEIYFT